MRFNSFDDPLLKTKLCIRWDNHRCPHQHNSSLCRYAHGTQDRHRRPRPKRRRTPRCTGGGLLELRNKLPYGDTGRIINSFCFATHPDALAYQQAMIITMREKHQDDFNNCPPHRLTLITEHVCYCCGAEGVEVYHRYYYPKCFNWEGWIFCQKCKPILEQVVGPQYYEQHGDLPPQCFDSIRSKTFFFDRVSQSQPHQNGITQCSFKTDDGPIFHRIDGVQSCTVTWHDQGEDWNKTVPLKDVLLVSKERWPNIRSFLQEFRIHPSNPLITPANYQQWHSMLSSIFFQRE